MQCKMINVDREYVLLESTTTVCAGGIAASMLGAQWTTCLVEKVSITWEDDHCLCSQLCCNQLEGWPEASRQGRLDFTSKVEGLSQGLGQLQF